MDESNDEIEVCQNVGPHELLNIKSKAVVKFSAVQVPVNFLECNTNLNLPPSNWLTTSDSSYGLHQALYQSPGFASFRMAHMFPDCVGEVDVVSDAENIKKLLKLPYTSKSAVSMIVHKVGNTLLLDEFDIQKYLLRKADDDWKWLRTFIMEQLLELGEKDHNLCLKDKSREAIQTKNLLSKFLYHSLKSGGCASPVQQQQKLRPPLPITGPVLPEPKIEENVPDPKSSHVFNRNVVWTFEDIRMLIGTDMPIFGGPNRPCISLRLRDMAKPINVLTGIDYWLDNLMCNVPEVVMCYHLDGIVQKYEIIKTEDLPYLENSQFSPQVVRNVAQNILSFLKANATKSGHTYWLFKGRNDDVVKLYDLTTLCRNQTAAASSGGGGVGKSDDEEEVTDRHGNPFTVPVAMLLYTVARNMKNTATHITPKTAGSIRALLDNCIKLLPKEKYPQIVTSSHYILSDLHVPAGIDPKSPKFDSSNSDIDSDTQSVYEEDEEEDDRDLNNDEDFNFSELSKELSAHSNTFAVKNICDTLKELHFEQRNGKKAAARTPSPLHASVEERCRISLEHISAGISCLQFFNSNEEKFIKESEARAKDEEKLRILHEEQNPNMARPFKPIPLPYESLNERQQQATSSGLETAEAAVAVNAENELQHEKLQTAEHKNKKSKLRRQRTRELDKDKDCIKAEAAQQQQQTQTQLQPHRHVATNFNSQLFGSWNVHLKLLLLEKACLTYATYAEHNYVEKRYGASLKAIYMSCRCQQVVIKYMSTIVSQKRSLLGRAGDCFFQMAKNWEAIDEYLEQFQHDAEFELNICSELEKDLNEADDSSELIKPTKSMAQIMMASCQCYERALEFVADTAAAAADDDIEAKHELLRRLGNVNNELGLKWMFWAQDEYNKLAKSDSSEANLNSATESEFKEILQGSDGSGKEEPFYVQMAMRSFDCLTRGIAAFTEVQDSVNLAFLYCNMGRFMRFRAHLQLPDEKVDFELKQKLFYNEAFMNYEKARVILGSRKSSSELWDLVSWELSTATFTIAKLLQDFSISDTVSKADLEKEVLDLLQKALKLCDVDHPGTRQVLYTYRSGLIHKRIASFHYSQLRSNCSDTAKLPKTTLQLCRHHYEKSANILKTLKESSDYLVVQLERISLQEFLTENSAHNTQKLKHMQLALDIFLESETLFEDALSMNAANDAAANGGMGQTINVEFHDHMALFESRLQNTLKTLIKLLLSGKDPRKLTELYKKMYMETLTGNREAGAQKLSFEAQTLRFYTTLVRLNLMEEQHKNAAKQQQNKQK